MTPDEYIVGPIIPWFESIEKTLTTYWSYIEQRTPRFYQQTYKFDRPVAEHADYIRKFFDDRGVFAVVKDYSDPKVGNRSWLTIIALNKRFSKYKGC